MAHRYIKKTEEQIPAQATVGAAPLGTETIASVLAAGEIGIFMEDTFDLNSVDIEVTVREILNEWRERSYANA